MRGLNGVASDSRDTRVQERYARSIADIHVKILISRRTDPARVLYSALAVTLKYSPLYDDASIIDSNSDLILPTVSSRNWIFQFPLGAAERIIVPWV